MDEAFCLAGPRITDDDPGSRPHEGKTAMMTKTAPKTAPWIALAGALTLAACTTTDPYTGMPVRNNTGTGVLTGAGVGAVLGYLTNTNKGEQGRKNALIGAGVGALAGGLTGNAIEQSEHRAVAQATAVQQQQQAARQLGLTDIVQMVQGRVSDPVIISQIRTTGSLYNLSATDIQWLKDSGVSDAVIVEMQQTATRPRQVVYGRPRPVYVVEEPVYVAPAPVVGVGVT